MKMKGNQKNKIIKLAGNFLQPCFTQKLKKTVLLYLLYLINNNNNDNNKTAADQITLQITAFEAAIGFKTWRSFSP